MILKSILTLTLIIASGSPSAAADTVQTKQASSPEDAITEYRKAIQEAKDDKSRAVHYKELGDYYASRDDYKKAAGEYISALNLYRGFSENERLKMAVSISWGDRLKEAIKETVLILDSNPANNEARIHLARCLSWEGKLQQAIDEADKVLKVQPAQKDALLIKANSLNWQGNQRAAIPIYRSLIAKEKNFDAHLGLANSLLTSGKVSEARENGEQLHPLYPYQERELNNFKKALKNVTRQEIDFRYSYYEDTEGNILSRYGAGYGFWLGDFKMGLNYRHTAAQDRAQSDSAEEVWLRAYTRLNSLAGFGAATGMTVTSADNERTFVNGQLTADFNIPIGTIGLLLAQDTFIDTAELIRNRIRYRTAFISASQRIIEGLTLYESYGFKDFSDNNNSHAVQVSPAYTIYTGVPVIRTGYRFRYMNYDRQSGSGYFDPKNFTSHQLYVNLSLDKDRWYGFMEPYGGYQSFTRNNTNSNDFFGGITGTAGHRFSDYLKVEVNGEFGNFAMQTATGFEYYLIDGRLILNF